MMLPSNIAELALTVLRDTAQSEILPRLSSLTSADIRTKAHPGDVVTAADVAAEARISDAFRNMLPDCVVIGEESSGNDPRLLSQIRSAELSLIIDPVDGTLNFTRGIPIFGTMISLQSFGETVFACLYDPVLDDAFVSEKGAGAWRYRAGQLTGRICCDTTNVPVRQAGHFNIMATPPELRSQALSAIAPAGDESPLSVTSLACSCHEYRQACQGLASFVISQHAKPWDHAAGVAILREAGGNAVFLDGRLYHPGGDAKGVIAATSLEAARYYQKRFAFLCRD